MATETFTSSGTSQASAVPAAKSVKVSLTGSGPVQTYARIVNETVVEVVQTAFDINKQFDTKSQVWVNCTSTPGVSQGWLYQNNAFTAPASASATQIAAASAAQATSAYKARAQRALTKSDATMMRVQEAITLGQTTATAADVVAFVHYRRALRTIISAADPDVTAALPVAPAYPVGT